MTIKQQGGIFGRNPTFNDVDVEGTLTVNGEPISDFGTMAQQDANSVNIDGGAIDGTIIGANSATSASFTTIDSAEATYGITDAVAFSLKGRTSTFGTNAIAELSIQSGAATYYNGALVVKVTPNYNSNAAEEVARFTSGGLAFVDGKGIDFSATSGTGTSELFDDYEEGTFTPVLSDESGNNATAGFSNGVYTKIGRTVVAEFYLLNINTSGLTSGDNIRISLPFTHISAQRGTAAVYFSKVTFSTLPVGVVNPGQAFLELFEASSGADGGYVPVSTLASGTADVFATVTFNT